MSDPLRYLAEAARAAAVTRMVQGGQAVDGGLLDAAGYPVDGRALREAPPLLDTFGDARPTVLMVHDGRSDDVVPQLRAAGFAVDTVQVAADRSWFDGQLSFGVHPPPNDAVATWILARTGAR